MYFLSSDGNLAIQLLGFYLFKCRSDTALLSSSPNTKQLEVRILNPLQDMESKRCVHLIARQVAVLILSMALLLLSGPILVKGQGPVYLLGDNITLSCMSTTSSNSEVFTWSDQAEVTVPIYLVNGPDVNEKTFGANSTKKYDNFDIDNKYPTDVNLLINLLEVNDAGRYICTFIGQAQPAPETVVVEAIPTSVSISCARSSSIDCASPSSPASDSFNCNCTAIGAYPDSLEFDWSSGTTGVQHSRSNNKERTGTFDFYSNADIVPTENSGSVTCTLNGYEGTWSEGDRSAVYNINPPMCELKSICNETNTGVSLTCTCTGASPAEGLVYSFFRDSEHLSSGDNSVFETAIKVGQEYTFGCRGCNGVNYGSESYVTQMVTCPETTESTTEKSESTTTKKSDPDFPIWVIILIIVVVLAVVIAVIAVIMYKKGKCGSNSSSDKLDDNGAGPRGDPEIPAYGVVDKNRTKDPTPAPRSSMRDSKNPSNPKQDGPLELQYAALDHGNKPPSDEVRKPKEEPTEYATVQSVIV